VLSPGVYTLASSLTIKSHGQVILGIGMASLVAPTDGSPCVAVESGVTGARVAGIMLQASDLQHGVAPSTLLKWGEVGDPGSAEAPGVISDVFARVGGPNEDDVQVDVIVSINSGNVIGDNLWLWRADHSLVRKGEQPSHGLEYHLVTLGEYRCNTGLEVHGDNVTIYGLQVEHTVQDLVKWNGNGGKLYFFQSELPYDVTQESFCDKGYAGYSVDEAVESHEAYGIGVYSYFRDHECLLPSAIKAPEKSGIKFVNTFTKHLNGYGSILSIWNGRGPAVGPGMARWAENTTVNNRMGFCSGNDDGEKVIGGDRDEHGCIRTAGYTWCEATKKCLRTWEEECPASHHIRVPYETSAASVLVGLLMLGACLTGMAWGIRRLSVAPNKEHVQLEEDDFQELTEQSL